MLAKRKFCSTSICSTDVVIYEKNPEYLIQVVNGNRNFLGIQSCLHVGTLETTLETISLLSHIFLLTNTCPVLSKLDEIKLRFTSERADVAVITKSWIAPNTSPDTYSVDGYNILCKCRTNTSGGGVLLYVKDHIRATVIEDIAVPPEIEGEWIMLNHPKFPPESPYEDLLRHHIINATAWSYQVTLIKVILDPFVMVIIWNKL